MASKRKIPPQKEMEKSPKQSKKEEKEDKAPPPSKYASLSTPNWILDCPDDSPTNAFLPQYVEKRYVCSTRIMAENKREELEDEAYRALFQWLLKNRHRLKIESKITRVHVNGHEVDISPLNSEVHVARFASHSTAEAFVKFIQRIIESKSEDQMEFDEETKERCASYLGVELPISEAEVLVASKF